MSVTWKYALPVVVALISGFLVAFFSLPRWTVLLATVFFGIWVTIVLISEIRGYIRRLSLWHGMDASGVASSETIDRESLPDYLKSLARSQDPAAFLLVRLGSAWSAVRVASDKGCYQIDYPASDRRRQPLTEEIVQHARQQGATVVQTTNEAGRPIGRVVASWRPDIAAAFLLEILGKSRLGEPMDRLDIWSFGLPRSSS